MEPIDHTTNRRVYELTEQQFLRLTEAFQSGVEFALNIYASKKNAGPKVREYALKKCQVVWRSIADEHGVDYDSILPHPSRSPKLFTASPHQPPAASESHSKSD